MNVRTNCPECGDVVLAHSDLRIRVCVQSRYGTYVFVCSKCGGRVVRPAPERIVELLVAAAVPLEVWDLPAELAEVKDGPPICHDDLLDWHLQLESGAALRELGRYLGDELMRRDA
jgi:rRNA maturation protein Nop10